MKTPTKEDQYQVSGTTRLADGKPAVGLKVNACDRDIKPETLQKLGKAVPQADCAYRITYTAKDFLRPEKRKADLFMQIEGFDQTAADPPSGIMPRKRSSLLSGHLG